MIGTVGLTPRQHDALVYLTGHPDASYAEMRAGLGLNSNGPVQQLIAGLEERGYIRRLRNRARAIEVLKPVPIHIHGARYRFIPIGGA